MRSGVSLLMSQGHHHATKYPLAFLWNEISFARQRINAMVKTEAVIMHTVIVQALMGGEHLGKVLEKLNG